MYDYLSLLHAHSLDLSTSFRLLSNFNLSRSSEQSYLEAFAAEFAMSSMPVQRDGEVERATEALNQWLKRYASRAQEQDEQDAWAAVEAPGVSDWQAKRTHVMKAVNPRFVLRQWVLEECIKEMEDALGAEFEDEGIRTARAKLGKILHVRPVPYPS